MAFSCVLFLKEECDGCAGCGMIGEKKEKWTREARR